MINVKIRFMYVFDLLQVINIEKRENYQWSKADFISSLKERGMLGLVASNTEDKILGFCIYDLNSEEGFHILHMKVDNRYKRNKIGTQLLDKMKKKLTPNRNYIEYVIPETNLEGQLFLKSARFKAQLIRNISGDEIKFTYKE